MAGKRGRPSKAVEPTDARKRLVDAAIALITQNGIDAFTAANVVETSGLSTGTFYHHFKNMDDLMMTIVKEVAFDLFILQTPIEDFPGRVCELYSHLVEHYSNLGVTFMKRFYNPGNKTLASYMCEENGHFAAGTAMARCEDEARVAIAAGVLKPDTDPHKLSADICSIVKGCLFDWAMSDLKTDIQGTMARILQLYLSSILTVKPS